MGVPDGYNTYPSFLLEQIASGAFGNVFFVDSGAGSNSYDGLTKDTPFATLDYAVGKCTANNGDLILVMPGHAESLATATTVVVDVAGITIVGVGSGAARPTFNATAADGAFKITAASTVIKNLLFTGGIDATTGCLLIQAADCKVIDCEYRDVTGQATDFIVTTASADRLLIDGLKYIGDAAAGANSVIALVGVDDAEIKNCYIYGNFAVGAIDIRTTACARVNIHDCKIWTENSADIAIVDTITGSTGWIGPNLQIMLHDNAANITAAVTGATFQMVDPVYVVNNVNEKAMLSTWTASTNA